MRLIIFLVAILVLSACGTMAKPLSEGDGGADVPPTATPLVVMSGDPQEGQRLFSTFQASAGIACSTCHRADSEEPLIGPGLLNVSHRSASRVEGLSASDYIRTSIVNPAAFVVSGYRDMMPKNWGKVFTEEELDDLVAYLMTL